MSDPVGETRYAPMPLIHPGPVPADRVVAVPARLSAHDVELPAGTRLLTALELLLEDTRALGLYGQLVGGELAQLSYYVPDIGGPGGPVADFSAPLVGSAPARLVRGGLTVGRREGEAFAHSHALFVGTDGLERAGHLIPDSVVLGEGVRARVWATADVAVESMADPETTMTLFVPRLARATGRGDVAGLVCRVRPNVDLVAAIERLTAEQGWRGADVRGQIGSLVGGVLEQPDGSMRIVDGPATEVMFLNGAVRTIDGRVVADLSAHLVDRHGQVHRGRLVPGANLVAMTYELALTERAL